MENRVQMQPAYVLHRRPFQNSSLLIDFLTLDYGRVRAIAKGARRQKSRSRSLLQLFTPVLVSLSGRSDIKTVTAVEAQSGPIQLQGVKLFSGMYMNELLVRLLQNQEEQQGLYRAYQDALLGLQGSIAAQSENDSQAVELVLRRFELSLLTELGYALDLFEDCQDHQPIAAQNYYAFHPDTGFTANLPGEESAAEERVFLGQHLIDLREFSFVDAQSARSAKRLLRLALNAHLGDKPLASRSLFAMRRS